MIFCFFIPRLLLSHGFGIPSKAAVFSKISAINKLTPVADCTIFVKELYLKIQPIRQIVEPVYMQEVRKDSACKPIHYQIIQVFSFTTGNTFMTL
jgi:hypothetical protein